MTAAIILAAGAATRMGQLKQLLPYRGETLLGHAVQQAVHAGFQPVVVVVGSEADAVRESLSHKPVVIVENPAWQSGMGSSISAGMRLLTQDAVPPAAIAILLGDQPLVEVRHLQAMQAILQGNEADAIAAEYGGTLGVPAIFNSEMFDHLASLSPGEGARRLLRHPQFKILSFPFPEAAVDLDTPEDFAALPLTSSAAEEEEKPGG
ncbi:MAG TPA: nucleotidyltransferase family protein [Bryobacteraceae bacterium]